MKLEGYSDLTELLQKQMFLFYRGFSHELNKSVIIKIVEDEGHNRLGFSMLKHEYELIGHLKIDGLLQSIAGKNVDNHFILIFEDVDAIPLSSYLKENILDNATFLKIVPSLTRTLSAVHAEGIIHKGISPEIILINPETGQTYLTGFMNASNLHDNIQIVMDPVIPKGSISYISPELTGWMNRAVDYRTDLYSLGILFYEMLTRSLPFESNDPMELIHAHIARKPLNPRELNSQIDPMIAQIIVKLLEKNAECRYQSAYALSNDLKTCLDKLENLGSIEPFVLGKHDLYDCFQVPHRLYGRETQIKDLMASFERAREGEAELVLVAGYSGIGKSALINEIHKPIVQRRGYFIRGKFDQLQRDIPYSALILAFQDLVRQLLTLDNETLNNWQQRLLAALGENGAVIIDVIPEVELIIGPQPEVLLLGPEETQNRFNMVFSSFLQVFTSKEHPLVIFIDDLQWADSATLSFINMIMSSKEYNHLMMLGAYRDNEVDPTHPFTITVEEIKKSEAKVQTLTLGPLSKSHLCQMLSESFYTEKSDVSSLAVLLLEKTGGNPFFVIQFLLMLYDEKLVFMDPKKRHWRWDVEKIRNLGITDNIVELLVKKVLKLPKETQTLLQFAACIGAKFKLKTLAVICKQPMISVARALWPAVSEGLIQTQGDDHKLILNIDAKSEALQPKDYPDAIDSFLHDRVQQAAYSLIEENERQSVHIDIGRQLLKETSPEDLEENIFDIVPHLNIGAMLIKDRQELNKLAELNLIAAIKAKNSTAWKPALNYLNVGLSLLPKSAWKDNYKLAFQLNYENIDCHFRDGQFSKGDILYNELLQHITSSYDNVMVNNMVVINYGTAVDYMDKCIDIGLQSAKILGMPLEKITSEKVLQEDYEKFEQLLEERSIKSLIELPPMTDKESLMLMNALMGLIPPTYLSGSILYLTINIRMLFIIAEHGNCELSPFCYASQAMFNTIKGQYVRAYQFSQLAIHTYEKYPGPAVLGRVYMLTSNCGGQWGSSLQSTTVLRKKGYEKAMSVGDLYWGMYTYMYGFGTEFVAAKSSTELLKMYDEIMKVAPKLHKLDHYAISAQRNAVLNVRGEIKDKNSVSTSLEEENVISKEYGSNLSILFSLELCQSIVYFFSGNYEALIKLSMTERNSQWHSANHGMYGTVLQKFLLGLAIMSSGELKRGDHLEKELESILAWFEKLAKIYPANYECMLDLLKAEKARCNKCYETAFDLYENAIKSSHENDFVLYEAISNELCSRYWLEEGSETLSAFYLSTARDLYQSWGAYRKVEDLTKLLDANSPLVNTMEGDITRPDMISSRELDLAAVIKVSQSISREMDLNELISKLLKISIESAGAQQGVILLLKKGELIVEADGNIDDKNMSLLQSIPISEYPEINQSIVNYVQRTGESVVINNQEDAKPFVTGNAESVTLDMANSILCIPVKKKEELLGVFYLENRLASNAFTPERLELLKIITAQAAISLENALMFSEHKKMMKELEKNELILQAIIDNAKTQISLKDLKGRYKLINHAFKKSFGVESGKILGKSDSALFDEGTALALSQHDAEVVENKASFEFEQMLETPDTVIHVIAIKFPLLDSNDKVYGICRIATDISDQKRDEAEKLELERKFFTAQRLESIGRLAGNIANDFNTIIGTIYGLDSHSLMLLDEENTEIEELKENLDLIEKSAKKATDLTQKLLIFSRQQITTTTAVNLNDVINSMQTILSRLVESNYEVIYNLDHLLADTKADASQMEQVILNFVVNARDAMAEGGQIVITTRNVLIEDKFFMNHPEIQPIPLIELSVTDRGGGMSSDVRDRIFEPFFTTKEGGHGTGLGLSMTYGVVKQSHGYIYCDSELGKGTCFSIYLPQN